MKSLHITLAPLAAGIVLALPASAAVAPGHIRGTIASVSSTAVEVTTAAGSEHVAIGPKTGIIGVVSGSLADVTPGTFIGTANVDGPGASRALEITVFPKAMAGMGEGNYPWDLPASGGHGSMMTNGTVAGSSHSMMTNATVSHMSGGTTKTIVLDYKGGTKTVTVTSATPIVRILHGSKALLVTGAHIVAFPGKMPGPVSAIAVGENGVVPPM